MGNIQIEVVGTRAFGIARTLRMGSYSLDILRRGNYGVEFLESTNECIVLLRDTLDRFKSGYYHELYQHGEVWEIETPPPISLNKSSNSLHKKFVNYIIKTHTEQNFTENSHNLDKYLNVTRWTRSITPITKELESLDILKNHPNVYFTELKSLSNPKLLEFIKTKDKGWKDVLEITYPDTNKTKKYFWEYINLFWKEYKQGDITDRELINPIDYYRNTIKKEQKIVDDIRKNHPKYIKFS